MFEARLKRDGVFQEVINQLQRTRHQTVWMRWTSTQLLIEAMDERFDSFVQAHLNPNLLFDSYRCDGVKVLPIDLAVLNRMLRNHRSDDDNMPPPTQRLLMRRDADGETVPPRDSLKILSERPESVCVYEIAPLEEPQQYMVPEVVWECNVQMPAKKFHSIIHDLDRVGYSEASILVSAGGVLFSGGSSFSTCTRFIPCSTDMTISINQPVAEMIFRMSSLVSFAGMAKVAEVVKISMKKDTPVQFEFHIIHDGTEMGDDENHHRVRYHAAPMMHEDCSQPLSLSIERKAPTAFEARLPVKVFTRMFEAVNCITGSYVATIQCHPEGGIQVQTLDSSHVSLVDITIPLEEFEFFRCNHVITLEVDVLNVCPSLEDFSDDTVLTLMADCSEALETRALEIRTEDPQSGEIAVCEMTRTKDDFEWWRNVPPADLQYNTISMPSILFQRVIRSLKGGKCFIRVTEDSAVFCATNISRRISEKKHDGVVFDVKETSESTFSLPWLKTFVKAGWLSSTVILSVARDKRTALKVEYDARPCRFNVHLAPRVENDLDTHEALSERVRAAREMTPITKKIAKEIPPLKRKRKASESNVVVDPTPAKKTVKPRKCRTCKVVKPCNAFSKRDHAALRAHCIDCMVTTLRRRMEAHNEPRTWQCRETLVEQKRAAVRRIRASGCERYECPIFFPMKMKNMSEDLQVSFARALPEIGQLVGDYDLVYTLWGKRSSRHASSWYPYVQRTAKGIISLSSQATTDKRGFNLNGSIEVPEDTWSISNLVFKSKFVLSQTSDESCHEFELPIKVSPLNASTTAHPTGGPFTGSMRVLARRTATCWNPMENPREEPWSSMSWEKPPVLFNSVEEAEILVKRWEETFLANCWLKNHLGLPPELAMRIHQFVAFRPAPAFFFEKGDLWMELHRVEGIGFLSNAVKLILVARRRSF